MKKIIAGILILAFSAQSFAFTEIASIKERNSQRVLLYGHDENSLVFKIKTGDLEQTIKKLDIERTESGLISLRSRNANYHFEMIQGLTEASRKAYRWCYDFDNGVHQLGLIALGAGALVTLSLCAILPGTPFLLGVALLPVDGAITLADKTLDPDYIAAQKFQKLISGKNKKASPKVFRSLVDQIKRL